MAILDTALKWFKHDSNAIGDPKIEELVALHGIEGYGFYFACVELIANRLSAENPCLSLKHSPKLLAKKFSISEIRIKILLDACLKLKLFVIVNKEITCEALLKRSDDTTRRELLRIKSEAPTKLVRTKSGYVRFKSGPTPAILDKTRLEERREEKRGGDVPS